MEDEYDVENDELFSRNGEGDAYKDGVEDDAKLKDEECAQLSRKIIQLGCIDIVALYSVSL